MPASIFTGAISFGLVSVPITVLSATEDHSVRFRRIHTADNGSGAQPLLVRAGGP
jgi:DNA end-binding protein Ku